MKIGMLATIGPYIDHLAPIYKALRPSERGGFRTRPEMREYVGALGLGEDLDLRAHDADAWMVAAFRDLAGVSNIRRPRTPTVFMEHGIGLQWYMARHLHRLQTASLICAPNEYWAARYRAAVSTPVEVIGTPKMDELVRIPRESDGCTVALSFHWTGIRRAPIPPPERYRAAIAKLTERRGLRLLGHGHPAAWGYLEPFWKKLGIEPVARFADVVRRADVYACDVSSTIYEFAALDRPVVLLDHPDGPRSFIRIASGLRYTDYADVGGHADVRTLGDALERALAGDEDHVEPRRSATRALYPYLGTATQRAVDLLRALPPYTESELEADELGPNPGPWHVTNVSDRYIERAGIVFAPGETVTVPLKGSHLRQVTSSRYLSAWQ